MVDGSWISPSIGNLGSLATGRFVVSNIGTGSVFVDVLSAVDDSFLGGSISLQDGSNLVQLGSFNSLLGSDAAKIQIRFIRTGVGIGPEIQVAEIDFMRTWATSINLASDIQLASLDRVKEAPLGSNMEFVNFLATSDGGTTYADIGNDTEAVLGSLGSDIRFRVIDNTPRFGNIAMDAIAFATGSPELSSLFTRWKSDDWT